MSVAERSECNISKSDKNGDLCKNILVHKIKKLN